MGDTQHSLLVWTLEPAGDIYLVVSILFTTWVASWPIPLFSQVCSSASLTLNTDFVLSFITSVLRAEGRPAESHE